MLTPQEVQEKTFVKAVFGGYDMQTVDDFIDVLSADYNSLYNENSVLKSRMSVLVEKLEEYRSQENSMKNALLAAQKTADELVAATQKKCARAVQDAENSASLLTLVEKGDFAERTRILRESLHPTTGYSISDSAGGSALAQLLAKMQSRDDS